jgi:hypothetical protein
MECMLVPEKPTAPPPKVLCVAARWDGGSWMKYPVRAGKPEIFPDVNDPNHIPVLDLRIYHLGFCTNWCEIVGF